MHSNVDVRCAYVPFCRRTRALESLLTFLRVLAALGGRGLLLVVPSKRPGHIHGRVRVRQLSSGLGVQWPTQYLSNPFHTPLWPRAVEHSRTQAWTIHELVRVSCGSTHSTT